jgi:hypothetical protein
MANPDLPSSSSKLEIIHNPFAADARLTGGLITSLFKSHEHILEIKFQLTDPALFNQLE